MKKQQQDISSLGKKQVFFLDLDGTIYLGNQLFKGVIEVIEKLKEQNKSFFFLSNNSSISTLDYLEKLNTFNLDISLDNLILSQHPTIAYLKSHNFKRIFLLGTKSLKNEFKEEGFLITEETPEIIVLAYDKEFTYDRLAKASLLLQKDIPYIATHLDNRCPSENGFLPDAGGIASLLYKATERMPKVFGKPNKEMLLFKLNDLNISPREAVIIGDRLYTDIRMGIEATVTTCCVLSGETNTELIEQNPKFLPDFIIEGIWELNSIF